MSWVVEEWKDGLSGKALQKIQEFESQLDKLKKERQQKQFQLESLEAALQKQKQKFDSEKSEVAAIKRENQSLLESCDNLDKTRLKLTHDLQVKEQQVNFLEGQLATSRKQIERLEQELKKHKNDLDKSQISNTSELQPYSTPQKTFTAPATPSYRQHESRLEDLQEKYSHEVEERKRLETELKVLKVKLLNQSSVSHKDIARQQNGSSIFPWQQEQTPSKRRPGAASSMWNTEETPVRPSQQSSFMAQGEATGNSQQAEQLGALNQDLKIKVTELEHRLQAQEKDIKNQMNKFNETQSQLDKAKRDLADKERGLTKSKDDLAKMTTQHEQAVAKCTSMEQKLKQVTEEMNCQRHNSDSTRRTLEQKIKDQEKESQKDLAHLQSSHQALDQQFNQTKTKMSQEIQQAKKEFNVLQSEVDKVTALKNRLEKDMEEQKQRLFKSDQGFQASQTKEMELKKKCDEMQREHNNLSSQLQQGTKRLNQLEEEQKINEQSLKQSRNMVEDLKAKAEAQSEELKALNKKLECQSQSSSEDIDNLKKTLSAMETKEKLCQEDLNKQKLEVEQLQNKLQALEREKHDLQITTEAAQKEIEEVKQAYEKIVEWKNEKAQLIENTEADRNTMQAKIDELEKSSTTLVDTNNCLQQKLQDLDREKQSQIDSLKGELLNKCMELEEKGRMYDEMLQKYNEADQKHTKDAENTMAQIKMLEDQVKDLEMRVQVETKKTERMEQCHSELLAQYESACDLAKSKDAIIELTQNRIAHLQESASDSDAQQEQLLARFEEEKSNLVKECEESQAVKANEAEQAKLDLIRCEQDILLLQDQVTSLESALKFQKGLSVEVQTKHADLLKVNNDLTQRISEAEKREEDLLSEVKALSDQVTSLCALKDQCAEFATAAEESKLALENLQDTHKQTVEELQTQKTRLEKFEIQIIEVGDDISSLERENSELTENLERVQREKEDLSSKYQTISEAHNAICEEKTDLKKQISTISAALAEKVTVVEMLATVKTDLEASNVMCAELKSTVESLQKQHDSVVAHNSNLEKSLEEKTDRIGSLEADVKERSAKFNEAAEAYVAEMEKHLQKHKNLKEQLEVVKARLQTKCQEADEAEEKLTSCLSEISSLKEDLEVSNAKLKEVSEACDRISQEVLSCKQSASSHAQELETLRGALETSKRSEESKGCEIQTLKSQLREAELEKSKASDAVKEKNISMNKIKVQLEMLQMDLEDNEACITTYDSQIEELKGTVSILEGKFDHCETQKYDLKVALDGARDQLSTKTSEISQLMACLEDTHKQQHNNSALASELQSVQTTNENLKVALEAEVCKCTNIETIHNNLIEQKREVETNLQELQRDYQNALKGLDSLKLKNDSLQEVIQQLTDETQTLKLALEQATQQMEKTSVKNKEFEEEHTKLSHQLVMLQNEQSQFTNQYSQLLSQVVEQQSRIEQLQEVKKHERALNADSAIQQEYTEEENVVDQQPACENLETCTSPVEEITPPLITSADESSETESKALEVSEPVSEVDVHASIEEQLQEKSRELEELSHAFEEAVQTLEEQREVQLEQLRDQYTAELQKMDSVKLDLETKLVDERQHIEMLSSQLEVARQQMEELNLASQSLLLDDQENVPQAATADASLAVVKDDRSKTEELDDGEFFDAPGSLNESTIPETVDDDGAGEPLTLDYTPDSPKEQGVSLMELHASKDTIKRQEEGLQELHAQYELLTAEMAIRKELCKEMENKVHELEKEKSESLDKLASANGEKRVLSSQVEAMTEEIDLLKLQQQTSNSQLSDVLEMLEGLEHAKGGWDEKFLQIESELKRTRSEKSNLEKHILSMEVDLESMHEQKQRLETELESSRKTNGSLEQELSNAVTERGQLKQELFSCSEERESENQSLVKMKENAVFLEKNNLDTRELIRILEEDIHAGRKQFEEASNKIDILVKEKEELLEQAQLLVQNIVTLNEEKGQLLTEFGQLKDGENTVLRESESMVSKVHSLQEENAKLSLSLESSLLEKGEIAARLISTQEEVTQMRTGIEKLKVRIESDERKKNHMSQLLKAAQRKADSLQDNIEKLEREREDSDQNFEQVVLQAETTKAELEELEAEKKVLSATIDEMTMKLNNLREEKDRLEKELTLRIEEMQVSMQEVSQKLVSAEQANKDAEINQKNVVDELQSKLGATECALQTCRNELETTQLKEQDATRQLLSLQTANEELEQRLQKAEELQDSLQSVSQSLQNDLAVKRQQQITEREEEKAKLHAQLEELRGLVEEKQQWEEVREQLKAVAAEWEEKAQADSAKNETMQITTASLQSSVKQLETQLEAATVMNAELTEKINASQETNLNLQKELETERSATKDGFQLNSLNIQLQESQREAQSYKLSLETLAAEKEELARNLAGIQESLVEMKEREIRLEDALKQAQQQHVDKLTAVREEMAAAESKATELLSDTSSLRAREQELTSALEALQGQHDQCKPTQDELNSKMAKLSKERDGVLSKMNLWMKSCKQLESEKQNLAEENQKQGEQITSLKASQKLADGDCSVDDQKAELEELREALEEKTKEADDSMDRYCSLMVKVHKLEEANESLQNKVKQLTSQTSASKARKSTSASTQSEDKSSNVENTRPEAREDPEGHASAKRSRALAETPVKAQEALQNLAKRLKAGATPQPRLREEFSPEGLPDRVMKGFADIPKGEMSPFIVRRTAVQRCSPRLAAQNSPVAQQMSFSADQSRCSSKPPAEDSSSQEGLTGGVSSILASVTNSPRPKGPESPAVSMDQRKTRRSSSTRRTSDQHDKRRQTATPSKQDENCHVQ
ncbi:centromere protein F isoform X2 [Clupea harengus]|uniref:Centromere protein F isoform X2 n=1 Tax=Clupea harengus TaxID=7950 RepID=A0A6P8GKQ4_CLUHA|nr:centromere protein F isoform X2 [Clupea harengus]